MKLLLIVNPISGGVDKEPFLADAKMLCEKYGISYRDLKYYNPWLIDSKLTVKTKKYYVRIPKDV